jgi:mitochondrial fission protein ELM1
VMHLPNFASSEVHYRANSSSSIHATVCNSPTHALYFQKSSLIKFLSLACNNMQFPTTSALITGSRRKNKQEKEAMRKSLS